MNCDICGREIFGKQNRIVVEGAIMAACESCATLGTPYQERKPALAVRTAATVRARPLVSARPVPPRPADRQVPREIQELDLADNYSQIIQKGRKKNELSQEDLAMKVKERLSMIQKIELGKMVPDTRLARALEHVLRVKLLVPRSEPPAPKLSANATKEITFADVARIKKREGKDSR